MSAATVISLSALTRRSLLRVISSAVAEGAPPAPPLLSAGPGAASCFQNAPPPTALAEVVSGGNAVSLKAYDASAYFVASGAASSSSTRRSLDVSCPVGNSPAMQMWAYRAVRAVTASAVGPTVAFMMGALHLPVTPILDTYQALCSINSVHTAAAWRAAPVAATAGNGIYSSSLRASSASTKISTAATLYASSPISSRPAAGVESHQQRWYRHWARHRAFEKARRLPNRALRPGCCAASLFPPPIHGCTASHSSDRISSCSPHSSSGLCNATTYEGGAVGNDGRSPEDSTSNSRTSDADSLVGGRHANASSIHNKRKGPSTFTGFFSPNITGTMAVHGDYRVARTTGGGYRLVPPYPPRVNKTIEPYPPSASKYFTLNRSYPLQWRNIEYKYVPVRLPRPYGAAVAAASGGGGFDTMVGQAGAAWGGDIIRIFHKRKGWVRKAKRRLGH